MTADAASPPGRLAFDAGIDTAVVEARADWTSLAEPGDAVAARLVSALGPVDALALVAEEGAAASLLDAVAAMNTDRRSWRSELIAGFDRWRPRHDPALLDRRRRLSRDLGFRLLVPEGGSWPASFSDLGDHAPIAVWVGGEGLGVLAEPGVAIVGARAATGYGTHVAAELSAGLAERGLVVVSGAAYGIDGIAHTTALGSGGRSIAFLAGGLDRLYPTGHVELLESIARTGAVLSEVPVGTSPTRWRFLQRNRLIAAFGAATVVVEAGTRSGSLNTAGHAASLGRPLGAVPGPVTSASSSGCHRLLRDYGAVCVTSVDDVLEMSPTLAGAGGGGGAMGPSDIGHPAASRAKDPDERRVLDALGPRRTRTLTQIVVTTGLSAADAGAALGSLVLAGRVQGSDAGGWSATR